MAKQNKKSFSKWLSKLQQESWQLELLISGLVIFALLESLNFIPHLYASLEEITANESTAFYGFILGLALFIFQASVYIFLINLIIHILIRSLWIGAIGLRYVSGDIDYKKLNYNKAFTNYYKHKIGTFDNYIQKLENFSSILFSFTFLLFFILLSLFFFFLWPILFGYFIEELIPTLPIIFYQIIGLTFLSLGFLVAIDFISLGLLKKIKNKYFSAAYLPIYRFFSKITFSFLWRPMLLNFLDQSFTRRLFIMIVPYLIFLSAISGFSFINYGYYPNFHHSKSSISKQINRESFNFQFYDNERNKHSITDTYKRSIEYFSIPSNKVSGPIGEVFVKAQDGDKWLIEKIDATLTPFEKEGVTSDLMDGWNNFEQDSLINFRENIQKSKAILEKAILLRIDNQPIAQESISCDYYMHPHGNSKGLLCFFPMDSLQIGRHHLTVGKVVGKKDKKEQQIYLDTTFHTIPFIYEGDH